MNKVWTINRVFVHVAKTPRIKWLAKTRTQEIEEPYRGGPSVFVHVPVVGINIAVGIWDTAKPEEEALLSAMGGRIIGDIDALEKEEQENISSTSY